MGILSLGCCVMVKGISRQVIVVNGSDQKLFDQAIFILKDDIVARGGITDEALLKEAGALIRNGKGFKPDFVRFGLFWAMVGSVAASALWLSVACVVL